MLRHVRTLALGHGRQEQICTANIGLGCLQARVQFHVLLTTYEMVVAEAAELRRIQWQTLVVDEAHRLRRSTSRSRHMPMEPS